MGSLEGEEFPGEEEGQAEPGGAAAAAGRTGQAQAGEEHAAAEGDHARHVRRPARGEGGGEGALQADQGDAHHDAKDHHGGTGRHWNLALNYAFVTLSLS